MTNITPKKRPMLVPGSVHRSAKICKEQHACFSVHNNEYDACFAESSINYKKFCKYQGMPIPIPGKFVYECTFVRKVDEKADTEIVNTADVDAYLKPEQK